MSSQSKSQKRKATVPKECANPIFEQWVIEWHQDAVSKNSKLQYAYSKALSSLRKYPLPLRSGKECQILENFGPTIGNQIDQRLKKEPHLLKQVSSLTSVIDLDDVLPGMKPSKKSKRSKSQSSHEENDETQRPSKAPSRRRYIPAYRSGAYALLITLFKKESIPNYRGYMLKSELIQESQDHCDAAMSSTAANAYASAWNSMTTLVNKDLVIKKGNPVKFMLSIEGRELAKLLANADSQNGNGRNPSHSSRADESCEELETEIEPFQRVQFEPNSFEIILCVDTSETNSKFKKEDVLGELRKNGVQLEVIKLNIGDFVWICRLIQKSSSSRRLTISRSEDMILPYVIERKRTDDLASSIRDGRFHEQKHRLEQTGCQPIYLIESYGSGDHGLADGALVQAVANTQITNKFMIHETGSLKDTCAYLTHMTRHLTKIYSPKTVSSCTKEEWPTYKDKTDTLYLMTFSDFNEFGTKKRNWTVSEMFARHLMKIRGLSSERAFAIIEKYPTLSDLLLEYRKYATVAEQQSVLTTIRYGNGIRTIGPALSKTIHSLYTRKTFDD